MNDLQIFNHSQFGEIRAVEIDGKAWLVGKDVAERLGYSNPRKAIADHVDVEDKGVTKCDTLGGVQDVTIINESGMYSLVLSSKLPSAKAFKRWITSEVIPSIVHNGSYVMPKNFSDALRQLADKVEENDRLIAQIAENAPKVELVDRITASGECIYIRDLAKLLKSNGVNIGERRLFEWMRENGYLCSRGTQWNMPTQRSMDLKLFEITERPFTKGDHDELNFTTKVTPKGQEYFLKKFLG